MRNRSPIQILGSTVRIGTQEIQTGFPIRDAFVSGDRVIILYEPNSLEGKVGQFPNLQAFTFSGEEVWTAELPTSTTGECYYQIASKDPLVVYSYHSFECEINPSDGKIVRKHFLK